MAVVCNPIRVCKWSELMVVCVCHSDEVMREADANYTSGELRSALPGSLVGESEMMRAGSQVFALLMLFLYVILHNMCSGKSLQLLFILSVGMLRLSSISMVFVKIMLTLCMLLDMVV